MLCSGFNPRAHAGRDSSGNFRSSVRATFQSTRPRGARRWQAAHKGKTMRFQSTRPRGARLSIRPRAAISMFQSTRPRGARRAAWPAAVQRRRFQSTRPRGARPAPAWPAWFPPARFNPRAHAGRDPMYGLDRLAEHPFQSTRPRGARRVHVDVPNETPKFQSTRPRGARRQCCPTCRRSTRFQSTRPRGARPATLRRPERRLCVSIHAPTRGATGARAMCRRLLPGFQSTRPRGARPPRLADRPDPAHVSIHAPTRGATASSQQHEDNTKNTGSRRTVSVSPRKRGGVAVLRGQMPGEPAISWGCEPPGVWSAATGSRAEIQRMSGPFRSSTGLAPTCSTLVCQFLPR